jgi:hypothetical protein
MRNAPPKEYRRLEAERALAELRIELPGGFRVTVGTRLVPEAAWRRRKPAALLKLLALAPGHSLHREQAMEPTPAEAYAL